MASQETELSIGIGKDGHTTGLDKRDIKKDGDDNSLQDISMYDR